MKCAAYYFRQINNREQEVIVAGYADFFSNVEMGQFSPNSVNATFVIRLFKWLSDGEYPFSMSRPKRVDTKITVTRKQINGQKWLFLGILPLILALSGGVVLVRRRRK